MLNFCMRRGLFTTFSIYVLPFIFEKKLNPHKKGGGGPKKPTHPLLLKKTNQNKTNKQTSTYRLNGRKGKRKSNQSAIYIQL